MHSEQSADVGDFIVRRALPMDVDALVALSKEHAEFERSGYESEGRAARLSAALFSPTPRLYAWVAAMDVSLVGYATASPEYSTWKACQYLHMDCLFVRAQQRGAGVGAVLLSTVAQLAREHGFSEVQWQTPFWNVDACRFYRRYGGVDQPKWRFVLRISEDNCPAMSHYLGPRGYFHE